MATLATFKANQRLAYESLQFARARLFAGMTEIEAAQIIEKFFIDREQPLFFHRPFAWFGDRTAFKGFKRPSLPSFKAPLPHAGIEFMPTKKILEDGMAVTLDVAPAIDGVAVDIGYSFSFGNNPAVTQARRDLKEFRGLILDAAREHVAIKEIYRRVEELLLKKNYHNCHALYPLGVLGHRIGELPLQKLPKLSIMGFHPQAYAYLLKERFLGPAIMTADETRPLTNGLWAIEPHFGNTEFGVKFEEILVVTPDNIYWLDDDLPHVTEVD
jgi:Xaa-Pro aminopeptidase